MGRPCQDQAIPTRLDPLQGSVVTLVKIERFGSNLVLVEPLDDVAGCWDKQALVCVMLHQPSHWITYRNVQGQWWCLDSATPDWTQRRNTFLHQHNHTTDLLVFKE